MEVQSRACWAISAESERASQRGTYVYTAVGILCALAQTTPVFCRQRPRKRQHHLHPRTCPPQAANQKGDTPQLLSTCLTSLTPHVRSWRVVSTRSSTVHRRVLQSPPAPVEVEIRISKNDHEEREMDGDQGPNVAAAKGC